MLHDLYLLSCYYEPTNAVLYEDDLVRRYGRAALQNALAQGLVERFCAPCSARDPRFLCRLSAQGMKAALA